ncbi:hypothetical protein H072_2959 [Dactylellina haptotyla CBS 200.50]|uniref:Uncharacterized protein n=1 Tax=Dactylellina haptotyla (strain CBS 200.50) TaxID=1284197 RepID=S8AJI1_DACHA|nr:hypothetical protein H072_2959 [Dactylellina haptotyla CBS 200.50]
MDPYRIHRHRRAPNLRDLQREELLEIFNKSDETVGDISDESDNRPSSFSNVEVAAGQRYSVDRQLYSDPRRSHFPHPSFTPSDRATTGPPMAVPAFVDASYSEYPMLNFGDIQFVVYPSTGFAAEITNKGGCVPQLQPQIQPQRRAPTSPPSPYGSPTGGTKKDHQSTHHPPFLPVNNPVAPVPDSIIESGTTAPHPDMMGGLRTLCLSKAADSNEQADPSSTDSAPTTPTAVEAVVKDDTDSIGSLLNNTPMFPDTSQEAAPLVSLEEEAGEIALTVADNVESPTTKIELVENSADTIVSSVAVPLRDGVVSEAIDEGVDEAAVPKLVDVSPTESLEPLPEPKFLDDSSQSDLIDLEFPAKNESVSEETRNSQSLAKDTCDLKSGSLGVGDLQRNTTDSNSASIESDKTSERATQVKNTHNHSKKVGRNTKHAKSNSANSNKTTKSDMTSLRSSQTKVHGSEFRNDNDKDVGKPLEENRPAARRLNSDNSGTGRKRKPNQNTASTASNLPKANNAKVVAPAQRPAAVSDKVNLLPSRPPNPSRQPSDTSLGYHPIRAPEAPKAASFDQRGKYAASSTLPSYTARQPAPRTSRQYYASSSNQTATGYTNYYQRETGMNNNQMRFNPLKQTGYQNLGHQTVPLQAYEINTNYQNQVERAYAQNAGYIGQNNYARASNQNYNGDFQYYQQQFKQQQQQQQFKQQPGMGYVQTAPPTPRRHNRYMGNPGYAPGILYNHTASGYTQNGSFGYTHGHLRSNSTQGRTEGGGSLKSSSIVQQERYQRRPPSPPPIVKISIRDGKLLWPIGPFIPWNTFGCPPAQMESDTFINVLCTSVGILRLPFSVPFLRLLLSVYPEKQGDHIVTFPTMLADAKDMSSYWERCYYAQRFLRKYSTFFGNKPFEEIPKKEWHRVEILLGSDNAQGGNFNIYLSQPDENRLQFRCVEQKKDDQDVSLKATFFVTVHQTGVNQVQYSDPSTRDPNIPLPPLDGSQDPRTTSEYRFNLNQYLCLNESRGLNTHGFTDIGVPSKRLNFHPFTFSNFDPLWYAMAHLQEHVCEDDGKTIDDMSELMHPDLFMDQKGFLDKYKKRRALMMGIHGKFAEHGEVLKRNCPVPADIPPLPEFKPFLRYASDGGFWKDDPNQRPDGWKWRATEAGGVGMPEEGLRMEKEKRERGEDNINQSQND